jgi:hypothetical protein
VKLQYSLVCSKGVAVDADAADPSTTPSTGTLGDGADHPGAEAPVRASEELHGGRLLDLPKKAKSTLQILLG